MGSKIVLPPAVQRTFEPLKQFVWYDAETKIPHQVYRKGRASSTDPKTWATFKDAYARRNGHNLGFVFRQGDGLCGIDLDDCVDADGVIHPAALEIIQLVASYSEFSPSGRGIHIIARGEIRSRRHKSDKVAWGGSFEAYDQGRFFTVTGNHVPGTPNAIRSRQQQVDIVVAKHLGSVPKTKRVRKHAEEIEIGERYPVIRSLMAGLWHRQVAIEEIKEQAQRFNQSLPEPVPDNQWDRLEHFVEEWLPSHAEESENEFWNATATLRHIRVHAQANMAAPLAVLGCTLARVSAATPHTVHLPGRGAGSNHGSLNTFVALVGEPGAGKDQALADSEACVDVGDEEVAKLRLGSGEGLAHAFKRKIKGDEVWVRRSVLFQESEIETVVTLGSRKGATLHSELRAAWSASALGHAFADPSKALNVPAHSYRVAVVAGVQPTKAGPILADVGGGMPQRFIWLLASDPYAPDTEVESPLLLAAATSFGSAPDVVVMPVCSLARTEINENARERLRGHIDDPLRGHWLFCKLRVAACLSILHGCTDVDEYWWQMADWVMRKSDEGRSVCSYESWKESERELSHEVRKARVLGTASALGGREAASMIEDQNMELCKERIRALLIRSGRWLTKSTLRNSVAPRLRPLFDEALDTFVNKEQVVDCMLENSGGRPRWLYRWIGDK